MKTSSFADETIIRRQYDQLARIYDTRWQTYTHNTLSFLQTWAQLDSAQTILDVGCGTGELEKRFLSQNPQQIWTGVDLSPEMLAMARQKCRDYPHASFYEAKATALPFADDRFDVVISANAFHYFPDAIATLTEMHRVLKPDGKLIILDWCRDYLACRLYDIFLQWFDPAHQRCYTQAELNHFLQLTSWQIQRQTKHRFGWLWGVMAVSATPRPLS